MTTAILSQERSSEARGPDTGPDLADGRAANPKHRSSRQGHIEGKINKRKDKSFQLHPQQIDGLTPRQEQDRKPVLQVSEGNQQEQILSPSSRAIHDQGSLGTKLDDNRKPGQQRPHNGPGNFGPLKLQKQHLSSMTKNNYSVLEGDNDEAIHAPEAVMGSSTDGASCMIAPDGANQAASASA